jgi:hypothetical protein
MSAENSSVTGIQSTWRGRSEAASTRRRFRCFGATLLLSAGLFCAQPMERSMDVGYLLDPPLRAFEPGGSKR